MIILPVHRSPDKSRDEGGAPGIITAQSRVYPAYAGLVPNSFGMDPLADVSRGCLPGEVL